MGFRNFLFFLLFFGVIGAFELHGRAFSWFSNMLVGKKFHQVDDQVFRSAQLSAKSLCKVIRRHKIDMVINLRGDNPGTDWYGPEVRVVNSHKVTFVSLPMSTDDFPKKRNLATLLKAFDYVRKNNKRVLIHCRCGADRTGEACALWLLSKGRCINCAFRQLSLHYRHFKEIHPGKRRFIRHWANLKNKYRTDEEALKHYSV